MTRLKRAEVFASLVPWVLRQTSLECLHVHLSPSDAPSTRLGSFPAQDVATLLPRLRSLTLSLDIFLCSDEALRRSLACLSLLEELHLCVRARADVPPDAFPRFPHLHTLSVYLNFPSAELAHIAAANPQLTSLSFCAFVRSVETIKSAALAPLSRLAHLSMSCAPASRFECYFEDTLLLPHRRLTYLSVSHLRPWQLIPDAAFLAPVLPSLRHLHLNNERSYQRLIGPLALPALLSQLRSLTLTDSAVAANELILLFQDSKFRHMRHLNLTCSTATYISRLGSVIEKACPGACNRCECSRVRVCVCVCGGSLCACGKVSCD